MGINTDAVALANQINKKLKADVLVTASQMVRPPKFTSGSLFLDIALGGGWPGNQWVEVIGQASHGKTAITLKTVAANQRANPDFTTLWVAAEPYDEDQAQALGVDNERVVLCATRDMVVAYETCLEFAQSRTVNCIVIDSYPALIAPEEEEKDMDMATVALGARFTNKLFRKAGNARSISDPNDTPLLGIFINQWRDKIGWAPKGADKFTPGGSGKDYAFYTRAEVIRDEWIEQQWTGKGLKVKVGQTIKVKTIKNKAAAPRQVAVLDFYFRDSLDGEFKRGDYDHAKEIATCGVLYDVIERRGSNFYYMNEVWKGREGLLDGINGDAAIRFQLEEDIRRIALSGRPITERELESANG